MANDLRMVALGDSVPWGQGLLETQKYDTMVKDAIERNRGVRVVVLSRGFASCAAR